MPPKDQPSRTRTRRITRGIITGGALAGLTALAIASALGSEDPTAATNTLPVTDTTAPPPVQGSSQENSIRVTDTTTARPPLTLPAAAQSAQPANTPPNTTTTTAGTATTLHWSIPPRTRHPTWDNRLPNTWDGLSSSECHDTFDIALWLGEPYAWHYYYDLTGGDGYGFAESEVIGRAFKDSTYEPLHGTRLHTALTNLGLTTAQDIRNLGEDAINVRWYAWWVKDRITLRGNVNHPSCASFLAGANAVLDAPLTTTTTTTASPPATTATTLDWSVPPLTHHPAWDNRLPGTWDGLGGTECHETFDIGIWSESFAWYDEYERHDGITYVYDESEVIGRALKDPNYEPLHGTRLHTALTNLGLTTAQDIRNYNPDALNIRWYAWWVKREITLYGDANHTSCASILAGANAVLNAPLTTTTTKATTTTTSP